ncbi:hypothetical protein F7P69_03750 [Cellulosimicrobium funkei]|nr:hypothetical protein [Cellulosimicrobium funkei]
MRTSSLHVGEEVAASGGEDVQDTIERQGIFRDVDVLVGFFKEKFGTPSGSYCSATEREIETFRELGEGRSPGVLFPKRLKDAEEVDESALENETKQMLAYRKRLFALKDGGVIGTYSDTMGCAMGAMKSIEDQVQKLEERRAAEIGKELDKQKAVPPTMRSQVEVERIRINEMSMKLAEKHAVDLSAINASELMKRATEVLNEFARSEQMTRLQENVKLQLGDMHDG